METVPPSVSPHIRRVLKSFQSSANRTLQGPGGLVLLPQNNHEIQQMAKLSSEFYRKSFKDLEQMYNLHPTLPLQQFPVLTPADSSRSEQTETKLEGENIACFLVGGEKRLCLPQILNTVLRDYELPEIHSVCDDLHIFCSRCQPEQLDILKASGILPRSAPSCGLITKTDAERLCNALIRTHNDASAPSHPSHDSFKVYHECFGKCKGTFNPEAYTSPQARCIQCVDCKTWLTPQKFVCHSHKALENRTVHWGFDSANWRHYLLLAKHQPGIDKLQDVLERMKGRFDSSSKYKRKQGSDTNDESVKRSKSEESSSPESACTEESGSSLRAMMSAFQPWSPSVTSAMKDGKVLPAPPAIMREGFAGTAPSYLHSGPPVLLHPDKVVPHSDSTRYEPNYAPNVSLAPVQKCKGEDDEDEEEQFEKKPERAPTPEPGPSKPYREWDLSESDDSSGERSSPSQGGDELRLSPTTENQRALEIELEMIRQALDGKIGDEKEEKDRFLHEFCKLRAKHQELLNRNIQARKNLKQELANAKASTKEKLQVVNDKNQSMEQELNKLRRESENRLKEVKHDNAKLLKDMDCLQKRGDVELGKLVQINQELQSRLQRYEVAFEQIRVENIIMQDKLLQMGVNVLDLVKANCNGNLKMLRSPSGSPPQRSTPQRSPTEHVSLLGGYPMLPPHSLLQAHAERFIKQEREGCS